MNRFLLGVILLLTQAQLWAEDIELYVGNTAQRIGNKPQVLIIFDNSGSMNTYEEVTAPYDPNITYPAIGSLNSLSDKFVYFTKGTGVDNTSAPTPDSPSESRRFLDSINSCQIARERLATVGFYTGHIREYAFQGNSGSWQEIPDNNGANIEVIDCWDDVRLQNPNNAGIKKKNGTLQDLPDGYPIDGEGTKQNPVYYTADVSQSNTALGTGEVVTLYSDNYLRWYKSETIETVNRTRLDIAKDTVTNLIESAPSVDFGLQVFNYDYPNEGDRDGGRIVFGIQESTATARAELVEIIDLEIDGETNTPLCESLYEAMRYLGGKSVLYGNDDSNYGSGYKGNTPPRDTSIESSGNYISPYSGCSNEVYIILITDGVPTLDKNADSSIKALSGMGSPMKVNGTNNYLAALAEWMHNNDLNTSMEGVQTSTFFTIGFSKGAADAAPLLTKAAQGGGGKYYPAKDSVSLLTALQSALVEILRVNASFTSPSIASNNFDRTETLDSVYYAMFLPDRGPRWHGNLKKLRLSDGKQVDRNGVLAIDNKGNITASAKTFWSTSGTPDGDDVREGGVAAMLRKKTNRKLVSDIGTNGALTTFNKSNASSYFSGDSELAAYMGVSELELETSFKWAQGIDIDDADNDLNILENRYDIFGDPLHSKPLIVNYGGSADNQDIRIIVGTNAGALHMFKDSGATVDESWAFMPREFFPNIDSLRKNYASSDKVYGIDGSATVYVLDTNGNGSIEAVNGDKAWLFIGSRRGGSSYYGLDISYPDNPKLLWHINQNTSGFSELGQSWSKPKIGYSKLNISDSGAKPVLFFGGGYDISKDTAGVGADDTVGRAVYMVDAESGNLVWSLSPAANSATNTQNTNLKDSIPANIAIMDSDSDGLIDRLYVSDTGANVWRVDMPGSDPQSTTTPWTSFKVASLGGNTNATDRRFFSEPNIARAIITDTVSTIVENGDGTSTTTVSRYDRPYEAILIGSGDRSTPGATDTTDKFYMLKDPNIITKSFIGDDIPSVITETNLYDFTNNPYGTATTTQAKETLDLAVSQKSGWFIDLTGSGEKSVSAATAIAGVAYFNSFTPAASINNNQCILNAGAGRLYAVDLAQGSNVYNWRYLDIGDRVPDTPTVVIPPEPPTEDTNEDGIIDENDQSNPGKLLFVGVGDGTGGGTVTLCEAQNCDLVEGIKLETMRTHLYVEEAK